MTFHAMVFTKFNSGFCINKTRPLEISAKLYRFMIKVKSQKKRDINSTAVAITLINTNKDDDYKNNNNMSRFYQQTSIKNLFLAFY